MGDTIASPQQPDPLVADLLGCMAEYEREADKWKKKADKIVKRYRDDNRGINNGGAAAKFNILWSNVQTLIPATYARIPQPDVSRRFRDNDPVGRVAALLLERALEYETQHYPDYAATLMQCVQDRFLPGRGCAWVRYEPHFRAKQAALPTDGVEVSDDIDEPGEELDYECSPVDYVHWKDFGHSVARTWEEVPRVWRCVYMNEEAVLERFGEEMAKTIPYDASPEKKNNAVAGEREPKQAKIYEIWDKNKKCAYWLSKSLGTIIDQRPDPLKLSDFWPCPRPLFATMTSDTLIPVPDFLLYQDQAMQLDVLSERIDGLIKALQVKGVYDASVPELARLFTEAGNTDLIPVKNFAAFAEKMGLKGSIDIVDLKNIYEALNACFAAVVQVKEIIYEITGISDIVRGQSEASETLGAQKIKQNFVGLRLGEMKTAVAKFASEILCMKAQVICGKYSPQTIAAIGAAEQLSEADKPLVQEAIALLVGPERMQNPEAPQGPNPTSQFRIEVEADSMVQMDEQQEKENRSEFLRASGEYMKSVLPLAQEVPAMAPLIAALLKFGVAGYKVGRTIEGDFDMVLDQLKEQAANPQPKPDPEMMKAQAQAQLEQQKMQFQQQNEQQKMQFENQREQQRIALEQQAAERDAQRQMEMEQFKAHLNAQSEANKLAFEKWKVEYQSGMEMMIAELQAKTQVKTSAMSANAAADPNSDTEVSESGQQQPRESLTAIVEKVHEQMSQLLEGHAAVAGTNAALLDHMKRPKRITLPDGRVATSETIPDTLQ